MNPNDFFCPECPFLIPRVPLEAPFWELVEFEVALNLVPVVPMEALHKEIIFIASPMS